MDIYFNVVELTSLIFDPKTWKVSSLLKSKSTSHEYIWKVGVAKTFSDTQGQSND